MDKQATHGWTRSCWSALAAALLLAGCAASPERAEQQARQQEAIDDILSQPLDEEEYGKPRRCISERAYHDFEPLGDRYVVFKGLGGKLWLNELRGRCPGLERGRTLVFKTQGFQICELDRFYVSDWFIWERYQRWPWEWTSGIPCTLGEFRPITEEQLEAMRATLR